jgi:ATP-binding protein involved in chromosome partitioning
VDPRIAVIEDRLSGVDRIIAVAGSKGGIGKSVVASMLALAAADRGLGPGLFDLDFTSPSAHLILGADRGFPREEFGIDPVRVHGVGVMSVAFFAGDAPAPLRGGDATNALLELLAITRWGDRRLLVLDMPPGLGDTTLDVIRYLPRSEFLVVAGGSLVVTGSVRRALGLLRELHLPILGVVENLCRDDGRAVADLADWAGVPLLGRIPYDDVLEGAFGDAGALRRTRAFAALLEIARTITP